jgi:two-component system, chemotaxis family, protein-glutamate methylesterase/glutaminase
MNSRSEIVIIGSSWGGLDALGRVLAALPGHFAFPVVLVQHRGEEARDLLAELLDRRGPLTVREAEDKQRLQPGCVLVAPRGYHLLVERGHVELSTEAAVHHSRPSIDVTLESAAASYRDGVVGIVLTGDNHDGAAGLAAVRRAGGLAVVQDPASAERPAMPQAAIEAARPQVVASLEEIAGLLARLAARPEAVR